MKYEIGDKIIVLLTDEEGTVVDIINEKMVMIEVKGVKFPAYTDQIDFPYFKQFTQQLKKTVQKKKIFIDEVKKEKGSSRIKVADGVWLNFFPVFDKDVFDDDVVEKFKLHLVNQTPDGLNFSYNLVFANQSTFELKGQVQPLQDFYLHDVLFEDLNDNPRFDFEFTLAQTNKRKADYFEQSLKLKARQVFKQIEEMKMKQEASFSYQLFETYPDKAEEEKVDLSGLKNKPKIYDLSRIRDFLEPARTVVDLHIEKLHDDPSKLSNSEKLGLQLKTFEKYYELALQHKQSTLIIIHGIGSGKLKDEIHEILRLKREVKSFVNQYHPSFGYGATEIFFKQNN